MYVFGIYKFQNLIVHFKIRLFFLLFSLTSNLALDLPPSMPDLPKIWLQLPLQSHFQMQPTNQKQLQLKSPAPLSHFAPTRLFLGSRKRRNISAQNTLRRVQSHSLRSLGSNSCNIFFISQNCHNLMC